MTEKIKAIRVDKRFHEIEDLVVVDKKMELVVNNQSVGNFYLSPHDLEDFTIGYLLDEGLAEYEQIKEISVNEDQILVNLDLVEFKPNPISSYDGWIHHEKSLPSIKSSLRVDKDKIMDSFKHLIQSAEIWQKTGGTHVAGLVSPKNFIVREDVSRHVAVDKVIGAGFLEGINFSESFIVCSGRIPPDRVVKLANVGIPIMVTKAAPTLEGLKVGLESGMTIVGFLREGRFNIYTHPWRIENKNDSP